MRVGEPFPHVDLYRDLFSLTSKQVSDSKIKTSIQESICAMESRRRNKRIHANKGTRVRFV